MTDPTTCRFCGIPHKAPCTDEATAAQCPIRLARAARELSQPKGPSELPLNDQTPTPALTSDHPLAQLADISANVAPAPALPPSPPPAPVAPPVIQPLTPAQSAMIDSILAAHPAPVPVTPPTSPAVEPDHYARFKIQPIAFIRENELTFWQGNVIKYICRADAKNGVEDIEKAISYLLKERAYLLDPTSRWFEAQLPKGA